MIVCGVAHSPTTTGGNGNSSHHKFGFSIYHEPLFPEVSLVYLFAVQLRARIQLFVCLFFIFLFVCVAVAGLPLLQLLQLHSLLVIYLVHLALVHETSEHKLKIARAKVKDHPS